MAVEFTRWFLAAFFTAVAAFYTGRIILAARYRGTSPVFAGRPGSAHYLTHLAFRVFRVVIWLVCVVRCAVPDADGLIGPIHLLWTAPVVLIGDALLAGSFAFALHVHFYMGRDWRSGTHDEDMGRLITTGPFAVSRNPMLLAVQGAQIGLFLALPSVFTLVCLGVGLWAVHAQVRVEEVALAARHGGVYAAYRSETPRWLVH